MISQKIKFHKNTTQIKTYIEYHDKVEILRKTYDINGNLLSLKYSNNEYHKWSYDKYNNVISYEKDVGSWFKRKYNEHKLITEIGGTKFMGKKIVLHKHNFNK